MPGDATSTDWPGGQDVVLMSYLLSALTADEADAALAAAHHSLRPGGLLVVHDFMLDDDEPGPTASALWFLQYLAWRPDAWSFTGAELGDRLAQAGFAPDARGAGRPRDHEGRAGPERRRPMTTVAVGVTPMETRREVVLRLADLAEELGYSAFTVAEGWGYDAGVLLAEIATRTSRIELGTGVLNVWGRSPASIAMLASGLHAVSGGRFTLGLGAGSPQLAEGLHDVAVPGAGATARRDGPAGARAARRRAGGHRRRAAAGCGWPPPAPVPLHLAALGPAAVRLAGEVADAWVPFLQPRSGLKERMCLLEDGAARAGRPRPRVAPGIPAALSPEVAAWWVAFYLTSMGPLYATSLREQGFGAAVDAVVAANGRGVPPTVPAAAQVLVDELLLTRARGPRPLARRGRRPACAGAPARPSAGRAGAHPRRVPTVISPRGRRSRRPR